MTDKISFIDCQGLAGAWTLGTVKTGKFELVHRASMKGGFGDATIAKNRSLVGDNWEQDAGGAADEWTPGRAGYLCGTPPCSGFSNLNTQSERGPGAPINRCMWSLIDYAGACTGTDGRAGPQIVSFESVQAAYTKGRNLMQALRDHLENLTGQQYDLHHVLMSGGSVGSAQYRHRYFVVFARVPFGVNHPRREDLPDQRTVTYFDAIADLQGLDVTWNYQPYKYAPASEYARRLRDDSGLVSQHITAGGELAESVKMACERGWPAGKYLSEAFDALDIHPERYKKARRAEGIRRGTSTYKGLNWPLRINPNKSGYVQTGGCARDFAHWAEPRLLTVRELSRMMGYPDSWQWPESITQSSLQIGKCCPVQSGRWISGWVANALEGTPGKLGEELDDEHSVGAEYYYNSTHLYKKWFVEDLDRSLSGA